MNISFPRLALMQIMLLSGIFLSAQDIQWNSAPQTGYVYEISNREAQKLLTLHKPDTIFKGLLYKLVGTYDVNKGWVERPAKGHFILVKLIGNEIHCEYTSVFPYQVFLFKEYDALALQVLDLQGNVREDAKVKLGLSRLRIDPKSKTYRIENKWVNRIQMIATVELDGFRSVYNIEKHIIPSWHSDWGGNTGPSFYSYLITDKNKYKPGDRVQFKSYALSQMKSPLRKELEIWLTGYPKYLKIGTIVPHRPGSYAGEFRLHDSLGLVLDKPYNLQLRDKGGRVIADCSFRYEDYELFGNKLAIQLENAKQFYPENNKLSIAATDVNGLPLKDARASILVKTNTIQETFQPLVILPDTLLFQQINLDPENPTQFEIPAELFQKTNTSYEILVTVLNSENERIQQSVLANFFYSRYELTACFSNDSICFNLLSNGEEIKDVSFELLYDDEIYSRNIQLPYTEKLNPAIRVFHFKNEILSKDISLAYLTPGMKVLGGIQEDSFNIQLQNPQMLDVSWYIYQGNILIEKGSGKELDYKSFIEDRTKTYYVELMYSFGGQEQILQRQYVFKEAFLNVSLDLPERIYPGQKVDATIQVTDQKGDAVKGVDLTAFAFNGKLNYYPPDLPYYGDNSSPRPKTDYYSKNIRNKRTAVLKLEYKKWAQLAGMDTMMYYQFTFPKNNYFKYTYPIDDSTQFAPYIMQNGMAEKIYVIEINRRPVYYSWTDMPKNYSFYVSPNRKYEVSLRLFDQVVVLDSLSFEANKKTILSYDLDNLPYNGREHKLYNEFSSNEISRHTNYISRFRDLGVYTYAYVYSEHEFIPLNGQPFSYKYSKLNPLVGPVLAEKKTIVENTRIKTTYQHAGGFNYFFEDNIVYKMHEPDLLPKKLYREQYNPMQNVNDRVITMKKFIEIQETWKDPINPWQPRTIDVVEPQTRIKIFLPEEKLRTGVAAFYFQDYFTGKLNKPCYDIHGNYQPKYRNLPMGLNNAIVLYNNGTYLKMDSIALRPYSSIAVDLNTTKLYAADSISLYWLNTVGKQNADCFEFKRETVPPRSSLQYYLGSYGNITGTVIADDGTPLPGATIVIKGTEIGVITDIDGRFSVQIDGYSATLVITYVGYINEEIEVTPGTDVSISLVADLLQLSEVVVVGYGTMRKSDVTGSISRVESESISAPEDEIEPDENSESEDILRESEQQLYRELLTLKSIRSNFSDVGFWEPRLYTDKKGLAKFNITFPDDITRWNTIVYAMNRYAQTGTARKEIKSYKPLMAELHVPQFLTRGDSSFFLGKVLNYTSDSSIQGHVEWKGANTDFNKEIQFTGFHIDNLPVVASSVDSITARYQFTRNDGYFDGEERTVSVIEQGIVRAEGTLSIFQNGENKRIKAAENEKLTVEIFANQLNIYEQDARDLLNYRYACNEQLASKLIGLIAFKSLCQYEGKSFKYDADIKKMIKRLLENQNKDFLWSWWDMSEFTSYWMSAHILNALKCAKDAGYTVNLNIDNLTNKAIHQYEFLQNFAIGNIELFHSLAGLDANLNYAKYLAKFDSSIVARETDIDSLTKKPRYPYSLLKEKLLLQEIRQQKGLSFAADTLLKYKKEGIFSEVYFSDNKRSQYWYTDDLAANVIAYRLTKNDSLLSALKAYMQLYFISTRENGSWNTYQSSNVLMNVLPDLIAMGFSKDNLATVQLTGKVDSTINTFPYRIELKANEELKLNKETGIPLVLQQYHHERVTEAKTGVPGFAITSYFDKNTSKLEAGKPIDLVVKVEVTKDAVAEYVMIEVPIPGACSYADKRQPYYGIESHREYFKEQTVIFCERLTKGTHTFTIRLLPRYTGKYYVNPAQVSLMYFPVVNANTDIKKVEIDDL